MVYNPPPLPPTSRGRDSGRGTISYKGGKNEKEF